MLNKSLLAAALLMALAWPAHVAFADRTLADLDCPVSVLACSSEVNADCGNPLLERPENFIFVGSVQLLLPAGTGMRPVFLGRAPPSL